MNKKTHKSLPINLLSAFIIMLCVFVTIVSPSNSWFRDTVNQGVEIQVRFGDLSLNLYHTTKNSTNLLVTNDENDPAKNSNYIPTTGMQAIAPGTTVNLSLILSNEAEDSIDMYIRFKFELYARNRTEDVKISTTLKDVVAPTANAAGFDKNAQDNYYYYYTNSGKSTQALLKKNVTENEVPKVYDLTLFTGFEIPLTEFYNNNEIKFLNSETVYIKFYVDAQVSPFIIPT